jgi:HK97 family phage prohead protease
METKRAILPFQVKLAGDDTSDIGRFEGYGSTFGNVDLGGDIVERDAFKASLSEWRKKGLMPQMLWYHDPQKVIGDWLDMTEDENGLKVSGRLWVHGDMKVEEAIKAYNVLRGTSVKGLSIGYRVRDYETQQQNDGTVLRKLKDLELMEISVAPWAMNPQAEVTSIKQKPKSKREIERALREVMGFSQNEAKAFIAKGFAGLNRDDSESEILASLNNLSQLMEQ